MILTALGGSDNIADLEACITRLRVEAQHVEAVDEAALREAGVYGVVIQGNVVQVVVGPEADHLCEALSALR